MKKTNSGANFGEKIIPIFMIILFSSFVGLMIFMVIKNYLDDSFYQGNPKTEEYSVKMDMINPQHYRIKDNIAILDNNGNYKLFNNLIKTYDGKSYIYNEKELECISINTYDKELPEIPKQENAYKEIKKQKGKYSLIVYNKTAGGGYGGIGDPYLIFYKEKQCSNIYLVEKE